VWRPGFPGPSERAYWECPSTLLIRWRHCVTCVLKQFSFWLKACLIVIRLCVECWLRLPSQSQDIAAPRHVPTYTAWWQRHSVCKQLAQGRLPDSETAGSWTRDLSSRKPTPVPLHHQATLGLVSHWPCVTDLSGLSIYGLKASVREMSTPLTLLMGYGTLYLFSVLV